MGCWDEFCAVCGGPTKRPNDPNDLAEELGVPPDDKRALKRVVKIMNDSAWLDECVAATKKDGPIVLGLYTEYGSWETPGGIEVQSRTIQEVSKTNLPDDEVYGVVYHASCGELLESKLGYTLRFDDVWPLLVMSGVLRGATYGGIKPYQGQEFHYAECITDKHEAWLRDPTKDAVNAARILKVWKPLVKQFAKTPTPASPAKAEAKPKAKPKSARPSPTVSATECKGETRRGNDGNMWQSRANVNGVYSWRKVASA